jgi:hypothetical protein
VGLAIAVDAGGNAYVVGATATTTFPSVNPVQANHATKQVLEVNTPHGFDVRGPFDAFVTKLDPTGSTLLYSTYLGGNNQDVAEGVAVDAAGSAYVVGSTASTDLRTTDDALQKTFTRPFDDLNFRDTTFFNPNLLTSAFLARIDPGLRVTALPVRAFIGQPFTGAVASFTAPDLRATAGDFTASVDWGDGTIDRNTTIRRGGGPGTEFFIGGNHTYTKLGAFPVVVTVQDKRHNVTATTAYDVSQTAEDQSETTIAIDPTDPKRLFAAAGDSQFSKGFFAAYSTDGGVTWSPSNLGGAHRIAAGNVSSRLILQRYIPTDVHQVARRKCFWRQ